ncbi:MAG: Gfo/Idh/MocA family oxidoreductase [Rhodothermales bacterium]
MDKSWRIGILGLGHWYSAYMLARALPEYRKADLVAAAWSRQDQLNEFCDAFHLDAHTEYDALLARNDIDIVHLAPPVSQMAECAIAAARAGKHIILGKPMAMTLDEADRIVDAVEASGVTCIPFEAIMRLQASALRDRIDAGTIGDLKVIHQTARWSIAEDWYRSGRPGWFADPAHVPGGALIDEGIYAIDLFHWITGSKIVEVDARIDNLVHADLSVEDWGMATFRFDNGVTATLEGAWTINAPAKTGPSPKQNSVVRTELIGTEGEIIDQWFRDPGLAVLASGADQWVYERKAGVPFGPASPTPLAHLIECLETGDTPIALVHDARRAFGAALAAYDAARLGRRVTPD